MARLSVYLLGPMQVTVDGRPVIGFESDNVRALLAYLVVEAAIPHSREKLAGLLWPQLPEQAARARVRRALANLRRVIHDHEAVPPFLHISPQTIQFNRTSDAWVDVATFVELVEEQSLPQQAIHQLEEAVALYRGPFLEGFSPPDSAAFEEWALLQQEWLRRVVLLAVRRLAAHHEEQGAHERALQYALQTLGLEPWEEQAHQQVMRLLAYSGRRGAALAQFEACRRSLAEELGVQPGEGIIALYKRIRDGPDLSPPDRAPCHNLPVPLTPFVGREAELARLKDCLLDPSCRLLTLVGPGGIGKTRLALEAAADLVTKSPDSLLHGVYLVPLAPLPSVEALVPAVAQAVGQHLASEQQLLDYLRDKRMLLILDGFEHLLPASPQPAPSDAKIAAAPGSAEPGEGSPDRAVGHEWGTALVKILRVAPNVKIMVTSRTALNLKSEHLFPVFGMEIPPQEAQANLLPGPARFPAGQSSAPAQRDASSDITRYSAVKLFLHGARRVQPGFEPTSADLAEICRICRLVSGMPLAILLAAAWVAVLVPAEIAAQIERSFDFLEADWHDLPERLRSMRAIFDESWHLLSERERRVLQGLSVFRGGFTSQAAQQVADASLAELRALVAKSLLHRTSVGRYELHELLRQYAAERLLRAQQLSGSPVARETIHDRHSAYYTAALQRWNVEFGGPQQQAALFEAKADAENIRVAWYWAVERGQVERLDQALEGLEDFCWSSGRYKDGEAALGAAVSSLSPAAALGVGSGEPSGFRLGLLARTLAWQGNFCRLLGYKERAGELQRQGLAILERPELEGRDTRREKALILWLMGHNAVMDSLEESRRLYEHSLALCRELDDRQGMARALSSLGTASAFLGALDEARKMHEEALSLYRASDDPRRITGELASLAEIALFQGRFEQADGLARDGVARCEELGEQPESAFALLVWGVTLEAQGKFAEARLVLEKSLAIYHELGHYNYVASAQAELGSVNLHLGCYAEAGAHARAALALAREHGPPFRVAFALAVLGCAALVQGVPHRARSLLQESVAVYRRVEARSGAGLGWAQAALGYAARELEDPDQARQCLDEALGIATATGITKPLVWALPGLALLLAGSGQAEQAIELWTVASSYPLVANSRWFEDAAGRHIAAITATLSLDTVGAAQARGRAKDVWQTAAELAARFEDDERSA